MLKFLITYCIRIINILFNLKRLLHNSYCISSGVSRNAGIQKYSTIMERTDVDSFSKIGSYTYIGKDCYITKSVIGSYCSIANRVAIGQGEHDVFLKSTSSYIVKPSFEDLTKEDCLIGNDVWIGTGVTILRGVVIGDGAVIGANSTVTKSVPPYAIVVGSPAKIIKYRFDDRKIKALLKSEWWNHAPDKGREVLDSID